jgi:hypothetical protein
MATGALEFLTYSLVSAHVPRQQEQQAAMILEEARRHVLPVTTAVRRFLRW